MGKEDTFKKIPKYCGKTKKAFTLVEMLVALFIFSMIMVLISQNFIYFFQNYNKSKLVQRDLEEAQYAMAIMAKTIRTSAIGNEPVVDDFITVFDYSQNKCFRYKFPADGSLQVLTKSGVVDGSPCFMKNDNVFDPPVQMLHSDVKVNGQFIFMKETTPANGVGSVTIRMTVGDQSNVEDLVPIQTTVSLRDYFNAN